MEPKEKTDPLERPRLGSGDVGGRLQRWLSANGIDRRSQVALIVVAAFFVVLGLGTYGQRGEAESRSSLAVPYVDSRWTPTPFPTGIVATVMAARSWPAATMVPATRAPVLIPAANAGRDLDCADFSSQRQAQAYLTAGDPHRLDADHDGVACESLP